MEYKITRNSPLVSIVIPAYNHSRYLDEAIRSVLQQEYQNIELLVFDDGSTDDTRQLLEKYSGEFYWESQPNMGQVNTLNKGWTLAKGEILAFVSADDALLPNAVGQAVRYLRENPDAVLTYCDFNLIGPDSAFIRKVKAAEFNYEEMVAKFVCPPGPGAFFRQTAFAATGPCDNTLHIMLDYDYWLRLGLKGRFVRIPEVLALYRVHDTSQTFAGFDEDKATEPVRIISRFFETQVLPQRISERKSEAMSSAHLISAQLHFRAGRYRRGWQNLHQAFLLRPHNLVTPRAARLALNVVFNKIGHKSLREIRALAGKLKPTMR